MGIVIVRGGASGFAQEVVVGRHRLTADEPESTGGRDAGPSPYEFLLVALYARRKQWPLEDVSVRLQHSKIHAIDCAECETTEGMLDRFECEISLGGSLSDEQRPRLLEIAERCPVHRTLTSEITIRSRLV